MSNPLLTEFGLDGMVEQFINHLIRNSISEVFEVRSLPKPFKIKALEALFKEASRKVFEILKKAIGYSYLNNNSTVEESDA